MVTWWACLPDLIFNLILLELPVLPDQVRFASVCTTWRSAAKQAGAKLFTDPLFLIPTLINGPNNFTSFQEKTLLYSVGGNQTYSINFPFTRYGPVIRFCGSSYGWLILLNKDRTITLYKPTPKSTKQATNTIRLPPISTHTDPINLKVTLSADPSTSDHYTTVAIYGSMPIYSTIWTSGDENWTLHKDMGVKLCSATWYKNKLYGVTYDHKVVHIDDFPSENPRAITVCKLGFEPYLAAPYLAESCRGELLMIRKYSNLSTIGFKVYKLDASEVDKVEAEEVGKESGLCNKVEAEAEEGGGLYRAVEVDEIGGDALFLGHDSSAVAVGALGTRHKDCIYDLSDMGDTLNVFCLDSGKGETHNYHHAPFMLSTRTSWITFWVTPLLADDWI